MSLMKDVYQAFINIGWSPNQARIMTADVGRENDFNPQFVFGRHTDASNGKVNLGMISWQGSRGAQLDKRLKSKGLIKNGKIVRSQSALNEMASFMAHEIKTNPAYSMTKKLFLNNPNVSYDVGKKVLGNNFIRWDYSGKAILGKNVGKHHAKRDNYYRGLGGVVKGGYSSPQQPTFQAPSFRPATELRGAKPTFAAPSWQSADTLKGAPVAPSFKPPEWQTGGDINPPSDMQPTGFKPPEWNSAPLEQEAKAPVFKPPEFMPPEQLQITQQTAMPELEPQEWQT